MELFHNSSREKLAPIIDKDINPNKYTHIQERNTSSLQPHIGKLPFQQASHITMKTYGKFLASLPQGHPSRRPPKSAWIYPKPTKEITQSIQELATGRAETKQALSNLSKRVYLQLIYQDK